MLRTGATHRDHTQVVAGKLHVVQRNAVACAVCPNGLGSNAKDRPTRGQSDETGMNLGASRGELALADSFRRTKVAAVRTVQVRCDGDLGIHTGRLDVTVTLTSGTRFVAGSAI